MRKIYRIFIAFLLSSFAFTSFAQESFFSDVNENTAKAASGLRVIIPQRYRTVSLNNGEMKSFLWSLPSEKNVNNRKAAPVLALPRPDGTVALFNVWESSIQEPALEAKFPGIKTFTGQGIDDPYATVRLDYTPLGFHAQVLSVNGSYYVDPYGQNTTTTYISYFRTDNIHSETMTCAVADPTARPGESNFTQAACLGTTLRTYRLAVACTGEYAQAPGINAGTNPVTLHAAIVTTVNRVVGVYEKEVSVRMILVANNNLVEFLNAATDPFNGNNNANTLINESQTVIDANIGSPNYDIGHTFSTGGGGLAQLNSPCGSSKARGITGSSNPTGDDYDIDYVAHEMGHQFGGNHSMAHCGSVPAGTKFEVGSGTTIQAYAGICGAQDIQPHSDPYFHAISFDEISNFITTGGGNSCGVATLTGNNIPVIAALTGSGLSIPVSTPFTLTGSATDPDGDALTYNWEGWDLGGSSTSWNSGATGPVNNTFPLFKSRIPNLTGSRTFPDIAVILANYPANPPAVMNGLKGETLSPVARPMKFRLTVRDNKAGGGGVASVGSGCQSATAYTINVAGTLPFTVAIPNGGESYAAGSTQTVSWNVVGTNAAPFNVANVKISLSTDGGFTYPTVISASTPNDGSEALVIPGPNTTTARIKVEALANIFFDISNANFTISTPTNDFTFGTSSASTSTCPAGSPTVTIPTTVTGTFTTPIVLSATAGVPAGTTVTFAPNPLTPGNSAVATLNNAGTLAAGTYTVTVTGTAGATVHTTTITYIITAGAAPTISTHPLSQGVCAGTAVTFTVASPTAGAAYQWQVSTTGVGGTFTNIAGAVNASYNTGATTAAMNGYAYHAVVSTQCGSTTSNNAVLTVNTPAAITTQPTPATQSVCTGNTATFTAAASGTGVTYQWQSSPTGAAGTFVNIAGATNATYTTGAVTGTTDGFYRVIVTTTTCAGTVTSNTVTLTISTTTSISNAGQPAPQTVCAPAAAAFTVTAAGTGNTYQWQVSTTGTGGTFTNIAGAVNATYNTGATTAAMNGYAYRVVVTGSCNTVTSNAALLTVNTAAALPASGQPAAQTVCNGTTATFTAAATGTGVTYQWQSGPSATGPFTNIAGATGATYTTAATTPAMNGTYYRVIVTTATCAGTVTSTPVLLTVNTVATITTPPTAQSVCVPAAATFTVAATGTGLGYQWQVSTDGGATFTNIAGATSATYTTGAVTTAMNGYLYRVLVSSTCAPGNPTTTTPVALSVNNPVSVTANPQDQRGCAGDNYTFSVTATPATGNTYQWQVSMNGGPYVNIAGATSPTYTITNALLAFNGNRYRVIVSGGTCGQVITPGALLTLGQKPAIILTAANATTLNPSVVSGLYLTVSPPNGNYIYSWTRNGVVIPNTLGTTQMPLTVDNFGTYRVTVIDAATGCSATSNTVVIDSSVSTHLFIYPNPVSTTMQVRYYSADPSTHNTMLNVYDSKGARVMTKAYTITGTYGRMDVDMSKMTQGTYMVELRDASGKRLATSTVIKGL